MRREWKLLVLFAAVMCVGWGAVYVNARSSAPAADVTEPGSVRDAVAWMCDNGISVQCGELNYSPTKPVTRGQVALMLYRYHIRFGGSGGLSESGRVDDRRLGTTLASGRGSDELVSCSGQDVDNPPGPWVCAKPDIYVKLWCNEVYAVLGYYGAVPGPQRAGWSATRVAGLCAPYLPTTTTSVVATTTVAASTVPLGSVKTESVCVERGGYWFSNPFLRYDSTAGGSGGSVTDSHRLSDRPDGHDGSLSHYHGEVSCHSSSPPDRHPVPVTTTSSSTMPAQGNSLEVSAVLYPADQTQNCSTSVHVVQMAGSSRYRFSSFAFGVPGSVSRSLTLDSSRSGYGGVLMTAKVRSWFASTGSDKKALVLNVGSSETVTVLCRSDMGDASTESSYAVTLSAT